MTNPAKKSKGPLFWILLGCGGIGALGILGIGGCVYMIYALTKPPADATHAFFKKINDKDYSGAYAMTSDAFKEKESREKFDTFAPLLANTDVTLNNRNVSNASATMTGSITLTSGETYPLTVELIEVGDKWLIGFFRLEGWKPAAPQE